MTEPTQRVLKPRTVTPRPTLHGTVLNVAAVVAVASALVWSALFLDLLSKRGDAATTPPAAPAGQVSSPGVGQSAQTPAPLTTRTS